MSRRVMIVSCNFPPDASVGTMRTLRLVRQLAASGWGIDVVTLEPRGFRPGTVIDQVLVDRVPSGVNVIRALPLRPFERLSGSLKSSAPRPPGQSSQRAPQPSTAPRRQSRLTRAITAALALPDREVSWLAPAVFRAWKRVRANRPDVVYSSGPPFTAHIVALLVARLTGCPWVADFRDPWARAPWREDRFSFEKRAWEVLERLVVTHAQAVVFATDTNRLDFARAYGPAIASRFFLVPNGCDATEFEGVVARPHNGAFVLLHAGSLYGARNPAVLFRALASAIGRGAIDAERFRLRFIGRLGINLDLQTLAKELHLERIVEFVNHMPRRDSLQEMMDASALLIVQPVTTVSIPAKLYEYLAAGKPILALAEPGGETAELVLRSRAGLSVPADDQSAVEEALIALSRADRGAFPPAPRELYDGALRAVELERVLVETGRVADA